MLLCKLKWFCSRVFRHHLNPFVIIYGSYRWSFHYQYCFLRFLEIVWKTMLFRRNFIKEEIVTTNYKKKYIELITRRKIHLDINNLWRLSKFPIIHGKRYVRKKDKFVVSIKTAIFRRFIVYPRKNFFDVINAQNVHILFVQTWNKTTYKSCLLGYKCFKVSTMIQITKTRKPLIYWKAGKRLLPFFKI